MGERLSLEVKRGERGGWWVYINGQPVSDHSTHAAARIACRNHYIEAVRRADG